MSKYLNFVSEATRNQEDIIDESFELFESIEDLEDLEIKQTKETEKLIKTPSKIPELILNGSLAAMFLGLKGISDLTSRTLLKKDWGPAVGQIKYFYDYWDSEELELDRVLRHTVTPGYGWQQQGRYRKAIFQGKTEMRRLAKEDDRTCPECREFSLSGWVPIGTLPRPGIGCRCLDRCRCILQFR